MTSTNVVWLTASPGQIISPLCALLNQRPADLLSTCCGALFYPLARTRHGHLSWRRIPTVLSPCQESTSIRSCLKNNEQDLDDQDPARQLHMHRDTSSAITNRCLGGSAFGNPEENNSILLNFLTHYDLWPVGDHGKQRDFGALFPLSNYPCNHLQLAPEIRPR